MSKAQNLEQLARELVWTPGTPHPEHRVVAAEEEGHWIPAPGYRWADDPPVISNVQWCPGMKHPQLNLVAGAGEGDWEPAPGYTTGSGSP